MEYTKNHRNGSLKNLAKDVLLTTKLLISLMVKACVNSLYVSGCMFHCEGCYNAATWSFKAGIPYTKELEEQIMRDLLNLTYKVSRYLVVNPS